MNAYNRSGRPPILVRKVVMRGGKRRGGIYYQNGEPAREITQGERYKAKVNGAHRDVVAGPNQIMYLLEDREDPIKEETDPRVRATLADARVVGFDLTSGAYRHPR